MNGFFQFLRSCTVAAVLTGLVLVCHPASGEDTAAGRDYVTRNWQIQDGLPDNSITAIIQARSGFLWVGTNNGVARFDGVGFLNFESSGSEKIRVSSLAEDSRGNIWVGTMGQGLQVVSDGVIKRVQAWPSEHPKIHSLQVASDDRLVVRVDGGSVIEIILGSINEQDVARSDPKVRKIEGLKDFTGTLLQKDGTIYGWNRQGVFSLSAQEWKMIYKSTQIDAFSLSRSGGLWVVEGEDLKKVGVAGNVEGTRPFPPQWAFLNHPWNLVLEEVDQSHVFMGGYLGGIFKAGLEGELRQPFREPGLFQSTITTILTDRQGSVWFGTSDCGLYRAKRPLVSTVMLPEDAISRMQTVANHGTDGFWVGTSGDGVFLYSGGELKRCRAAAGIANLDVRSILEDSNQQVWVGTRSGLFRLLEDRVELVPGTGPERGGISAIIQDSKGDVLAAGGGGVGKIVRDGGRFRFDQLEGQSRPADFRAIAEDGRGGYWIGGVGVGLLHWIDGRLREEPLLAGMTDLGDIVSLFRDREGTLWIGDYESGLYWIRDGKVGHVTTAEGLVSDSIVHLTEDRLGRLWIGTTNGLMAIRKADLLDYDPKGPAPIAILSFNTEDGMSSPLCSGGGMPAFAWDRNDQLFFANLKGLGMVDASRVEPPGLQAVAVDRFKQDGRDMAFSGDSISVPSNCKRLEILLTALDLASPNRVRLKCRLSGYEEDWYDMGFSRTVSYQNLPAGEYELNALAVARDGSVARLLQPVKISVVPRFWERMWFRSLVGCVVILALCAVGWWFLGRRSKREISRLKFQNLISQERARIARDIHDEIGAGLAQIGILADVGSGSGEMPPETRKSLGTIGRRARSIVGSLDGIVWAINPSNDTLESLVSYIVRMGDEVFDGCGVKYSSDVPEEVGGQFVRSEVRYNLAMAVKEAFANALKHSRCNEVRLDVRWEPPVLRVVVSDNGTGFHIEDSGDNGNGLGNQRARMAAIGGGVEVASSKCGTRVELVVSLESKSVRE